MNIDDVALRTNAQGDLFEAQLGQIGGQIGAEKLGYLLHVVPAGKRAFPRHAHHVIEEMFVVLEGEGTYVAGEESWPIRAGDVISAPPGGGDTAHQIINSSDSELRYLGLSTQDDPDVVEYPDSDKFLVVSGIPDGGGFRDARILHIGRTSDGLDYWDGEET